MKTDNSPARGMRDLLPADTAVRDHVLASVTAVYRRYGYQRIETPALEDITRLGSGEGGDNEKLVFEVLRRGLPPETEPGTRISDLVDLGLRYDLTVPLTRFYGANQARLPTPFRSLQVGPVWRAERPQKGRYRQFYQCDIDMIGEPTVLAEAELIEATTEALAAVGLEGLTVRISDRRFLTALASFAGVPAEAEAGFFITLDKLDKIGWDGVRAELAGHGLAAEVIDRAADTITGLRDQPADKLTDAIATAIPAAGDQLLADLSATAAALERLPGIGWEFDPALVRGMGYYTGHIFEVARPGVPFSLAGGGRYDRLIGRWLGKDVPAVGFSIGFERIVDLLETGVERGAIAVLAEPDVPPADTLAVARDLRGGTDGVVEVVRRSGKFGAQLKRLEAAGFGSFVTVQVRDGEVVRGELRSLGGGPEA
ncbi:MAG: histidine--tRNA ligase [Nocardiopsaceae bacterium]|nr:histidine--tRNA ligase [Nocardiopsaceae bacterium]